MQPNIETMSSSQLVSLYNQHASKPVRKFADRATAVKRLTQLLGQQKDKKMNNNSEQPSNGKVSEPKPDRAAKAEESRKAKEAKAEESRKAKEAKAEESRKAKEVKAEESRKAKEAKAATKAAKETEKKGFAGDPIEDRIRAVRQGTKIATIIDLISRPQGATVTELQKLMSPKATVRGILAYDLRTLVGYGYKSTDGEVVHIVYPSGMRKPLAHVAKAAPPEKKEKASKKAKAAPKAE